MMRFLILTGLAIALVMPSAQAESILFDSGVEPSGVDNAAFSDANASLFAGAPFSLNTPVTITGIDWTGVYTLTNTAVADDFVIELFDFSGADPAATPLLSFAFSSSITRTDSGEDFVEPIFGLSFDIYEYESDVDPVNLDSGRYLLAIVNETDEAWAWGLNSSTETIYDRINPADPWNPTDVGTLDFTIRGAVVPEPGTLALMAIGLAAPVLIARRRYGPGIRNA